MNKEKKKSLGKNPVRVNDVVDPSASLTDPENKRYVPNSREEFNVAMSAISKDMPEEKYSDLYKKIKNIISDFSEDENISSLKTRGETKVKNRKDTKVESIIRRQVRNMISNMLYEAAPPSNRFKPSSKSLADLEDEQPAAKGPRGEGDSYYGASLNDILDSGVGGDKWSGASGVGNFINDTTRGPARHIMLMLQNEPDKYDSLINSAVKDYVDSGAYNSYITSMIDVLSDSGVDTEDVAILQQLLKEKPNKDIISDLADFRENHLPKYIRADMRKNSAKYEKMLGKAKQDMKN
jgi:hypothetical protein